MGWFMVMPQSLGIRLYVRTMGESQPTDDHDDHLPWLWETTK